MDGGSGRAGQGFELADGHGGAWVEAVAGEVGEEAGAELSADRVEGRGVVEVDAANEDATDADAGFEGEGEGAGGGPVVDHADGDLEGGGEGVEDHGVGAGDDVPPGPVGVGIGGEVGEGWVCGVAEDAEGVRRLAGGPGDVPEDGGEAEGDGAASGVWADFVRGDEPEDWGAELEGVGGIGVEVGDDAERRGWRGWRRGW